MNILLNPVSALYAFMLRKVSKGCETLLDIGCGQCSPPRFIPAEKTGIDGYEPALEAARTNKTHKNFVCGDVRNLSDQFESGSFDCVTALDLIEHLTKEDGLKLLDDAERIAKKRVIIFTPNGFMPQDHKEEGDLQEHLSGWDIEDFENRDYRVYGMLGPKALREGIKLKYKPKFFWAILSMITQCLYCQHQPKSATSLLAVKTINPE